VGAMPRALVAAWRAVLGYVWWTEAVVVTRWEGVVVEKRVVQGGVVEWNAWLCVSGWGGW
jgi:hypothetical protein